MMLDVICTGSNPRQLAQVKLQQLSVNSEEASGVNDLHQSIEGHP